MLDANTETGAGVLIVVEFAANALPVIARTIDEASRDLR